MIDLVKLKDLGGVVQLIVYCLILLAVLYFYPVGGY